LVLNPRAYYAALLAAVLLAAAFITPLIVSKGSAVTSIDPETTCIRDKEELRALTIMYNQTIWDELRVLSNAARQVAKKAVESQNPLGEVNNALDELTEKYWADAARLILYIDKLYYAAHRYYECTGDAYAAAEVLVEIALNRPVSKVPGSTVAQVANNIKSLNASETLDEIKALKEAIDTGNRLPVEDRVKSVINYILLLELREELLRVQAQYSQQSS
jgi:hypothetical protein